MREGEYRKRPKVEAKVNDDWEEKERIFHQRQACERAQFRLKERRGSPFDLLLLNTADSGTKVNWVFTGAPDLLLQTYAEQMDVVEIEDYIQLEGRPEIRSYLETIRRILMASKMDDRNSNSVVRSDIQNLLRGKTLEQLCSLEGTVKAKLSGSQIIDTDYWEDLLEQVHLRQDKERLVKVHRNLLDQRIDYLAKNGYQIVRYDLDAFMEASTTKIINVPKTEPKETANQYSSIDNSPAAIALQDAEARKIHRDGIPFNTEAEHAPRPVSYPWSDRWKPRKPRFYNLVRMNYEWNKYNQTHYDRDNPPPKVVQGYRFNIFYPELADPSKAPTFRLERDISTSGAVLEEEEEEPTRLLRFIAGPPYEEIVFRIQNEPWDVMNRLGYRSVFENGVLRLHFWFRKQRYRR